MTMLAFPAPLAPFASKAEKSRGRLTSEPESATRTPFQRDRDRVIHAVAFRRLKHKTQVFVAHEGDHYRTRLTHSIEVSQVARSIARRLALDEDLAEALALAHDLGHPPFGHAGESALDACMSPGGGFDHNAQTLRIVTKLERRYPRFDGLNLTWETLEGVVKHNGPLVGDHADKSRPPTAAVLDYDARHHLILDSYPSLEAQVAAIADDIAYNNHDVDDGLRAGLFDISDMTAAPIAGEAFAETARAYPGIERSIHISETVRRLIGEMIDDVVVEAETRLATLKPGSVEDIRAAGLSIVAFSPVMDEKQAQLRAFLHENMYRHYRVNRAMDQAKRIIKDLFDLFAGDPNLLPPQWRARCDGAADAKAARVVCDFIAGMTDRYAVDSHRRLFNVESWI